MTPKKIASCNHHFFTLFESPDLYVYIYIRAFSDHLKDIKGNGFITFEPCNTGLGEDDYCSQCGRSTRTIRGGWMECGGCCVFHLGVVSSEPREHPSKTHHL